MTLTPADWDLRFLQQARWTASLRAHLFARADIRRARRILEAGCGTGAITSSAARENPAAKIFGLDLDGTRLRFAHTHDPASGYVEGDALRLPFRDGEFDLTFCHYLLLWIRKPEQALREMVRVTRPGGWVAAMAEPDHDARIDFPASLAELGRRQTDSLRRQGADTAIGRRLEDLFSIAGICLQECGIMQALKYSDVQDPGELETEWKVLKEDLGDGVSDAEWEAYLAADRAARASGERVLFIPTYYAAGTRV
jgi:SAM-dependent methyltransferase